MGLVVDSQRFGQVSFASEKEFEAEIVACSKALFGEATIFVDAKKKFHCEVLGATVPDGFFFDFSDPTEPQFYLVEVELSKHPFFGHIFPQITKFVAILKNGLARTQLVDSLFEIIDGEEELKAKFKKRLKDPEIHKFLSDVIEDNQNILLVADGPIAELEEINRTYDEWSELVRFAQVTKYANGDRVAYMISPDVEALPYAEPHISDDGQTTGDRGSCWTEELHFDKVSPTVRKIYDLIQAAVRAIDDSVVFVPQKYRIAIKKDERKLALLFVRKKKIRFIALLPEAQVQSLIKRHPVISLGKAVQDFYATPCAAIDIDGTDDFGEISNLLRILLDRP